MVDTQHGKDFEIVYCACKAFNDRTSIELRCAIEEMRRLGVSPYSLGPSSNALMEDIAREISPSGWNDRAEFLADLFFRTLPFKMPEKRSKPLVVSRCKVREAFDAHSDTMTFYDEDNLPIFVVTEYSKGERS